MSEVITSFAQVWGTTGAAFLTGFIACFSHAGVPTLNIAPVDVLVHEFRVMYNIGKATSPALALTATICNGFLAYQSRNSTAVVFGKATPFGLYLTAAICIPLIIPYTLLYMEPQVNTKLLKMGAMVQGGAKAADLGTSEKDIRAMLVRWRGMNFIRAGLVAIGALCSAVATIV